MNSYIEMINQAIEYIEENIEGEIKLSNISKQFYLSEYHFERVFRAIVGTNLKNYILSRTLTKAFYRLTSSDDSIINREFVSCPRGLILKAEYIYLETTKLKGVLMDIDINEVGYESIIRNTSEKFIDKIKNINNLNYDKFYSMINWLDYESGK